MQPNRLSRRRLLAAAAALLPFAILHRPALAGEEWCECDPAMLLTTPHGNLMLVYVTQSGQGLQHLLDLQLATLSYSATGRNRPDGSGRLDTVFSISVTVPNDLLDGSFPTLVRVSSGPLASGTIYASANGTSGVTATLTFTVPLP